jgi:hypothetical protein
MSLTPVITKCHSLLLHSWSLRAFAEIVIVPPVVPVVPVVLVDVPVEVPVDAVPVVLVLVFVPVDAVPVVLVFVPVLPVVFEPPVVLEPPVVVPALHSTQKTLCFSPPGACGVV